MKGTILLGGGGNLEQSAALDAEFSVAVSETNSNPSCLYVPHAMKPEARNKACQWFKRGYGDIFSKIVAATELNNIDPETQRFDAVYIGGGNTGVLLDEVYNTGFDSYIRSHLDRGGVLYGGSAGAIILGKTITTTNPEEHSRQNNKGLDLLGGLSVKAHYEEEEKPEVIKMARQIGSEVIAIPEESGLIVDSQGGMRIVGDEPIVMFNSDGSVEKLKDSLVTENQRTLDSYAKNIVKFIELTPKDMIGDTKIWVDTILALISTDADVLELGSGFGRDAIYMREHGYKIVCSDAVSDFVDILSDEGFEAEILDVTKDNFGDKHDLVYANAIFEHLTRSQLDHVVKKVLGSLKEGGHFAFSVREGIGETWSDEKLDAPRYFCFWTTQQIKELLVNNGFNVMSIVQSTGYQGIKRLYVISTKRS